MCKVSRGSEDHLVQGFADFGSFSQKMPLKNNLAGFLSQFKSGQNYDIVKNGKTLGQK